MSIMKDLKHYFADNSRACAPSNIEAKEVNNTRGSVHDNAMSEDEVRGISTTKRKRGRVKIKISQNKTNGRICDIIESKSDLVDKTPSPFAPRLKDDELSQNDTPKRTKSRKSPKIVNTEEIAISTIAIESNNDIVNSGDENDNLILNTNHKSLEIVSAKCERVESNAFHVLMTRKKSVQYRAPLLPQDEDTAGKSTEESRMKLKKNKEKLITLADKKGYTKRKLNEIEEAEKIERRFEKRAKMFQLNGKKENEEKILPTVCRRVSPGSLHNYFGKASTDLEKEDLSVASTIIVEAEVHVPDSQILALVEETAVVKSIENSKEKDSIQESLSEKDLLQQTEHSELQANDSEFHLVQRRKKKPRWSLRINLQSNGHEDPSDAVVANGENFLQGICESKPKRSKTKTPNYVVDESSDSETLIVKSSKTKKSSKKTVSAKRSSKDEISSPATPSEILTPPIVASNVDNIDVIDVIDVVDMIEMKIQKPAGKLAPLFVKRQKPDPAVLEARRAFLHSVSIKSSTKTNEAKAQNVGLPLLPFPTVSHVAQLKNEMEIVDTRYDAAFPLRQCKNYSPNLDVRELKSVTSLNSIASIKSSDSSEITKSNVEEVLSEIESRCSDAREIWTRISAKSGNIGNTKKSPKRRGKNRKSAEKKSISGNVDCGPWTEKYRPTSTSDIVGNEEAAEKFHKWLSGWKVNKPREETSSGDEFYSSDCNYSNYIDSKQVAVLLGPHGSGKTASVYAIAEELGYSVIEVNASSKRAGKRILKELEEATKSHRIKGHDFPSLKNAMKAEEKTSPKNSLILVEDVDLIFDEDEGFISATCQLASNTKRPMVMTVRDPCSHLNKIAPQQIRIYYQSAFGSRVSALLELITLAESGYRLPRPCLDRLLQNGDLRKALLQLQYLLMSGKPGASQIPTIFHQTLWQDTRRCVYKSAIRGTKKSTRKRLASEKKSSPNGTRMIIDDLANNLDRLSLLSTIIDIDDPAIEISSLKFEPSLSLDENIQDYSSAKATSFEIAEWLRDCVMKSDGDENCNDSQHFRQILLKKEFAIGVDMALSEVSPRTLDRRVAMVDYLSSIRAICRAEETKSSTSNKRGNRFFHYLQNLRLPTLSTRPSILAAACKILHDKDCDS